MCCEKVKEIPGILCAVQQYQTFDKKISMYFYEKISIFRYVSRLGNSDHVPAY